MSLLSIEYRIQGGPASDIRKQIGDLPFENWPEDIQNRLPFATVNSEPIGLNFAGPTSDTRFSWTDQKDGGGAYIHRETVPIYPPPGRIYPVRFRIFFGGNPLLVKYEKPPIPNSGIVDLRGMRTIIFIYDRIRRLRAKIEHEEPDYAPCEPRCEPPAKHEDTEGNCVICSVPDGVFEFCC